MLKLQTVISFIVSNKINIHFVCIFTTNEVQSSTCSSRLALNERVKATTIPLIIQCIRLSLESKKVLHSYGKSIASVHFFDVAITKVHVYEVKPTVVLK